MSLIHIEGLKASIEEKEILRGLTLDVKPGEVHAIMGPNGSGKSTLASVLAGREDYEVTGGSVTLTGKDLLDMPAEVRAREGLFLAFQYPVEIPGVSNMNFLKAAVGEMRKHKGLEPLAAKDFLKLVKEKAALVELQDHLANRAVNEGFSGGEKKRNEILQMAILQPDIAILDETDSGLDIDALRIVAKGVREVLAARPELGILAITHYQRLLDELNPSFVHVLINGRIVESGGPELSRKLEAEGYDAWL